MSGHNKWSTIKHKKGKADAKRGKIFTKIIRELTTAAREGGGDPVGNPRLRTAVLAAKAANMPNDTLSKAIQRGTGELPGVSYEEIVYEGYGPGGVAVLVEAATDNRNRTAPEIRHLFKTGTLGQPGSMAFFFDRWGVVEATHADASRDPHATIPNADVASIGKSWAFAAASAAGPTASAGISISRAMFGWA